MAALCVAVISKDNYPLFVKTVLPDSDLKFHYLVHTSLDVVEEKTSTLSEHARGASERRELYLGQLYPSEEYKIYGYMTNTKVKFILIVENRNSYAKDTEMKSLFKKLHLAYYGLLLNPFYTPGHQIQSKKFDQTVASLMQQASR
ncbi:trafficking protein particle complex subunit 2-like protein [Corticium candelabrum]|uniref:trafficking protein particle complex subunit 2-like protein n=1 Tax=Corticium candelabrum TaxID=121492 RepID=UPI002E269112|nr:trafficking protein particle complex subunit 2-like protein [Corticium candelabrum]